MHEVSLVQALFDQADRAALPHAPGAVRLLRVGIGAWAGVERALFETAFDLCKAERGYAGATLEIADGPSEDGIFLLRMELEVPDV